METAKTTDDTQYVQQLATHSKHALTALLDKTDAIDRALYGKRGRYFILLSLAVLVAPAADWVIGKTVLNRSTDFLTIVLTVSLFLLTCILAIAFIGSWRDDEGNWTWQRAKSRFATHYGVIKDTYERTRTNSGDESLYTIAQLLLLAVIVAKAFQGVSVIFRKPLESIFHTRLQNMRHFEHTVNSWYLLPLLSGIGILVYLYRSNPKIVERIRHELSDLFRWNEISTARVDVAEAKNTRLVINAKVPEHVTDTHSFNNSELFNSFVKALHDWQPRGAYYEFEFQDRLYRHLRKQLPGAKIEMEYPIGKRTAYNRGRADIVINDSIMIEMKRDDSAGSIQRAKGQIMQYTEIWKGKGPVVLLLCDYDYEHASVTFTPIMQDLVKLDRSAMTIVAKPKAVAN